MGRPRNLPLQLLLLWIHVKQIRPCETEKQSGVKRGRKREIKREETKKIRSQRIRAQKIRDEKNTGRKKYGTQKIRDEEKTDKEKTDEEKTDENFLLFSFWKQVKPGVGGREREQQQQEQPSVRRNILFLVG